MSTLEKIQFSIQNGRIRETEQLVREALGEAYSPEQILREAMVPAMSEAGREYQEHPENIPGILCAARSMQRGLDLLEPYMDSGELPCIGSAILGTVEGDLHEVGKNLVAIMFRSAGIRVIDLGVDVSARSFVRAIREHPEVRLVCISSLLTTSELQMKEAVRAIRRADPSGRCRIMVGGGSVTKELAHRLGADVYTETAAEAATQAAAYLRGPGAET